MLRVFEAFAGVGSQRMALRNIGVEHEVVSIAEIDKYALQSYEAIHGDCPNLGDISKLSINEIPDHDLFTYSFPCQDISVAGNGGGLEEGSGTRSSLLWECRRVIEGKKPKYLLLENVKNLVGKKNKPNFDKWLEWLEGQGYSNYWQILNAKDYGIPQNRERVFVVSILGEEDYEFPTKQQLNFRLKDILEEDVDEKYFLKQEIQDRLTYFPKDRLNNSELEVIGTTAPNPYDKDGNLIYDKSTSAWVYNPNKLMSTLSARDYKQPKQILVNDTIGINRIGSTKPKDSTRFGQRDVVYGTDGVMPSLEATDHKQPKQILVTNTNPSGRGMNGNVYDADGLSPTLTTNKGEGSKVLIKNATKQGYLEAQDGDGIDLAYPDSETRRGRVQPQRIHTLETSPNLGVLEGYRIRKLTSLECWKLMGFTIEDYNKAKNDGLSDTQLYKQAGNSIVVNVLEGIFSQLFLK